VSAQPTLSARTAAPARLPSAALSGARRHLAEFWMVEPEMAFADLADDMACAPTGPLAALRTRVLPWRQPPSNVLEWIDHPGTEHAPPPSYCCPYP